jgi:hypothetical protein
MRRFLTLAGLVMAATVLVVQGVTALFEPVAPFDQLGIVGVSLGEWGGATRIPRRALTCVRADSTRPDESCTAAVDGGILRIDVEYDENRLRFRRCRASYGPTTASCWPTWYALTGGPPVYAHVPIVRPGQPHETVQWLRMSHVAEYRAPHLELPEQALQDVRRQYPITNYYEADWKNLFRIASFVALGVTASLALLIVWRPLGRSGGQRREVPLRQLVLAASCGVVVFCSVYVGQIVQAMRAGLVD